MGYDPRTNKDSRMYVNNIYYEATKVTFKRYQIIDLRVSLNKHIPQQKTPRRTKRMRVEGIERVMINSFIVFMYLL